MSESRTQAGFAGGASSEWSPRQSLGLGLALCFLSQQVTPKVTLRLTPVLRAHAFSFPAVVFVLWAVVPGLFCLDDVLSFTSRVEVVQGLMQSNRALLAFICFMLQRDWLAAPVNIWE